MPVWNYPQHLLSSRRSNRRKHKHTASQRELGPKTSRSHTRSRRLDHKPEREEVAVMEAIMEVVIAPLTVPPLDVSARDWPCVHRASGHRRGGHRATTGRAPIFALPHQRSRTTSVHSTQARSPQNPTRLKTCPPSLPTPPPRHPPSPHHLRQRHRRHHLPLRRLHPP